MAKISAIKVLLFVIMLNLTVGKGSAVPKGHERRKRHLNWSSYTLKSSDTSQQDLHIQFYVPHRDSQKVDENEDYTAFTLYEGNTGFFSIL